MKKKLNLFARDKAGVSAVEFAMIAPVMITLLLGTVELSDVMMADRKVTSVNIEDTTTEVGWGDAYNTNPYAPGSAFTLPAGLGSTGDSVIVGEVTYTYNSVIGQFLGGPKELTDTFYMQPRRTLRVVRVTS